MYRVLYDTINKRTDSYKTISTWCKQTFGGRVHYDHISTKTLAVKSWKILTLW